MSSDNGRERYKEYAVVVDTNILMAQPHIERIDWGVEPVTVYLLESVVYDELEGLRRAQNGSVAQRATEAYEHLTRLHSQMDGEGHQVPGGRLKIVAAPEEIPAPLKADDVDQQQIALAYNWMKGTPDRFSAVVTRDRAMHDIAVSARPPVPVVTPGSGNLEWEVQEQLARLIRWTRVWPTAARPEEKPAEDETETPPPDRFEERAHNLYRRVQSAGYRAILAIAPRRMRLALGARLVQSLTSDRKNAVFLHALNEAEAIRWRDALHRRCELPTNSICLFGEEAGVPAGPTRVLIFRHDQIERRLTQYAHRFKQAGRHIVTVVDSCEQVNPVGISLLLFECDRFVGFTQHPFDHAQANSGRMLAAFFRQQTAAVYTFADAERDGWMHAYDFMRRPISLAPDEQEEYARQNEKFVAIRNLVRQQHPELVETSDFWQGLHDLLDRSVDHEAASLFELREKREQVAQQARRKLEVVERLVAQTGEPARCLIFDPAALWTNVLKNHLATQGKKVVVLEADSEPAAWESVWREFEQARLDVLFLQALPPANLTSAIIRRLILLTPLTPLPLLSAMVDWTLSHAVGGPPVAIDLIYASETPEQQAMVDFADACFGLRFR